MRQRHISTLRRARVCDIDPTDSRLNSDTTQYRPVVGYEHDLPGWQRPRDEDERRAMRLIAVRQSA